MSATADVAVIGVGSMGSMAMWQLARAGARAVGFEQYAPGHDWGAHGGESRIFRTTYMEGSEYVPLLQESERLWRELERETGRHLLGLTGGLMMGTERSHLITTVRESVERYALDHEVLDSRRAAERYPQHRLRPDDVVIVDRHAGYLRPELAVMAAAERAEALGAAVHRDTRVETIEIEPERVVIRTSTGTWECDTVIVAAGAWSDRFREALPCPIEARRLQLTWFVPSDAALFSPERFPIFMREVDGTGFWGMPMLDGFSVKVALDGTVGTVPDPDRLDRHTGPADTELIRRLVRELLPDLVPDPVRVGIYQDGFTPDEHFLVGRHPCTPRVVLACGLSGHGFKMAPAVGRAAAELAMRGETTLPVRHLRPDRWRAGVED